MWPFPKRTTAELAKISNRKLAKRARRLALFLAEARSALAGKRTTHTAVHRECLREMAARLEQRDQDAATMALLNQLREPVGATVEVGCAPSPDSLTEYLWVTDERVGWEGHLFSAETLAGALASAIEARRVALAQKDERA